MATEKEILTTGEIAKYCGVDFRTVIRWIDKGRIKAFRLPERGDRRVKVSDFLVFLAENQMPIPDDLKRGAPRILVVEDDERFAHSLSRILSRAGFDTEIASNGFVAGTLLETFEPTMLTLDLKMPGLNGFDVLNHVRSKPHLSSVKVLVISGAPDEELDKALKSGADGVLPKPFEHDALLEEVHRILDIEPIEANP